MDLNPITKFKRKVLRIVNGTVCVKTKLGWRSIIGMQVMILKYNGSKPFFQYGSIKHVVDNRVQIRIPVFRPGQDDKFHNSTIDDGTWTFLRQESVSVVDSPRTIIQPIGARCDKARTAVHPVTREPVLLQCVMRGAHLTCHFENPSNEAKKKEAIIKNG